MNQDFLITIPIFIQAAYVSLKAITGDEEILEKKIRNSVGEQAVNFIAILGTPNSAVIASDHKGVASILQQGNTIPVFTINTTGIETYENGAFISIPGTCTTFCAGNSM